MNQYTKTVITGLECCSIGADQEPTWNNLIARNCGKCPYNKPGIACTRALTYDAMKLLKAQEPKKVRCVRRLTRVMKGICPACELEIESVCAGIRITKFCKFCGQAVKWE